MRICINTATQDKGRGTSTQGWEGDEWLQRHIHTRVQRRWEAAETQPWRGRKEVISFIGKPHMKITGVIDKVTKGRGGSGRLQRHSHT